MKKLLFLSILIFAISWNGFSQLKTQKSKISKLSVTTVSTKDTRSDEKTIALRQCHEENLQKSPFKKSLTMTSKERRANGIPPNKYYESEWELTMNPETGKPTTENLVALRKKLEADKMANRAPGDGADNAWMERGPTNVGGRTRAVIFDPNDAANETVLAGGVSGGLWKNTNISNPNSVWMRLSIPENLAVSCITVDPNNSQIFYVGTGESYVGGDVNGDGVWKSIDGGNTWTNIFGGRSGAVFFEAASNMTVNSPTAIAGTYLMVEAPQAFGTFPPITTPITGDIVLVDSQTTPTVSLPVEGCNTIINTAAVAGKIAIIRRGTCNFTVKIKNAQDAGAIAAILMNNNTDLPFAMGGSDPLITIPSVMISQADGNMLQAALLAGNVNLSLNPSNGSFTGNVVPGIQHINTIKIRNNAGVSEIYVAAGDTNYGAAGTTTYLGGTTYGLYKSLDSGASWNEVSLPLTTNGKKHCPNDIEVAADNKIWLSTTNSTIFSDGGGKVFSSSDGSTFVEKYQVASGNRTQIEVSTTVPDKVYVLAEVAATPATVAFIATNDGFSTTTALALPDDIDTGIPPNDFTRGQAGYDLMLAINPVNDQKLFTGGIDIFDSIDGGTSWAQKSLWFAGALQEVHADQHAAAFAPGAANRMVFGNDGGVFFSDDSGTTIAARNNGFNVTQFYSLGVAPTTNGMPGDNFVAGAQDNGSQMFLNATVGQNTSDEVQGGDGAYSMFDQDGVDKYRITNYVYNNTIRLFNYATNATRNINTETAIPGNGAFITPMALDSRLDILYSDYFTNPNFRVRRYKNLKGPGAIVKAPLSNVMFNSTASALTVSPYLSPTSTSTLLIGTRNGRLLKVTNADQGTTTASASVTWTNITGPLFVGSVSDVEYGNSEDEIFVTFHNYNVVSIWYTADGGVTWQNKEGNFPDIPVKAILRNPANVDEVIIGTELGVWRTETWNTASPIWIQSQNGMQNVKVTDMDLRNDNVVYAATYGRGIFSGAFTPNLSAPSFTKAEAIKVFPNPSNGVYSLQIDRFVGKVNVEVSDANGRIILNQAELSAMNSIDLSAFQSGIYLLKVSGNGIDFTEKLIKN